MATQHVEGRAIVDGNPRSWLAAFAARHWERIPTVLLRIHFKLDKSLECLTLPTIVEKNTEDAPALAIGEATVDSIGYAFTNGANGIQALSISLRGKNSNMVRVEAKGLLDFGRERWLPFADQVQQTILSTMFRAGRRP